MDMEYIIILNGSRYEGEFKNYKQNGYGKLYRANGDKYEGQFKDDKFDGIGTYYQFNGKKIKGKFKKGNPKYIIMISTKEK